MLSKLISESLLRQNKSGFFQNRYAHSLPDNNPIESYENHYQSQITLNNYYFEKNYFRSKKISDHLINFLFLDQDLVYKSIPEKEVFMPIDEELLGLIAPSSLKSYSKGIGIEKKLTEQYLAAHRTGHDRDSSSFLEAMVAVKLSALIPNQQALMIIDLKNIPLAEIDRPTQTLSSETGTTDNTSEGEVTASSIHISAILKRASKKAGSLAVEYNPLYVDQQALSRELNNEYDLSLKKFYEIIPIARQNLAHPEIKQFKEMQSSFYEKYIEELKLSKEHAQAIRNEINRVEINEESSIFTIS